MMTENEYNKLMLEIENNELEVEYDYDEEASDYQTYYEQFQDSNQN